MPRKRGAKGRWVANGGRVRDRKTSAAAPAKSGAAKASGLSNRNFGSMTQADKVKAAAIMFGTGSKQHKAAQKKFGTKKGR